MVDTVSTPVTARVTEKARAAQVSRPTALTAVRVINRPTNSHNCQDSHEIFRKRISSFYANLAQKPAQRSKLMTLQLMNFYDTNQEFLEVWPIPFLANKLTHFQSFWNIWSLSLLRGAISVMIQCSRSMITFAERPKLKQFLFKTNGLAKFWAQLLSLCKS